jgi:hypothetical protein
MSHRKQRLHPNLREQDLQKDWLQLLRSHNRNIQALAPHVGARASQFALLTRYHPGLGLNS